MKCTLIPLLCFVLAIGDSAWSAEKAKPRPREEFEAATRLQVFLDRAGFGPGKIDGRYGEFTWRALSLYRESRGEPPVPSPTKEQKNAVPDVAGLDLTTVDPLFISYTVTPEDVAFIGEVPSQIPEQAKLKRLPYASAAEAVAEKFHTDVDFLAELNPGRADKIEPGTTLTMPNVEPFELTVAQHRADEEKARAEAERKQRRAERKQKGEAAETAPPESPITLRVDTQSSMLTVLEQGRIVGACPVTVGSERTGTLIGEWKVARIAHMPNFRWDKAMLNKGERSSEFHLLPPGPNNPVGVVWIALNKKGLGLHGTAEPDAIGRNASHGCIRLANWDAIRLAARVQPGVAVSVH